LEKDEDKQKKVKAVFKEAFNHTLKELEIPNLLDSIRESDPEKLIRAHDSIHEFIFLAPLSFPSNGNVSWHRKSAFLTYQFDVFYSAHRSLIEALAGYYNAGYTLLRSTLELILKGALWECLAHKKFRENAEVLSKMKRKVYEKERSLIDWFDNLLRRYPEIENDFEEMSAAVFDKVSPIFEDKELQKLIPSLKTIIVQLEKWGILNPIPKPVKTIYETVYKELCKDVHAIPDKTDIGRRLIKDEELFETVVIPEELDRFLELLHKVMDVGIVVELNILSDWVTQDEKARIKLGERLHILERLKLNYSVMCLRNYI